MERAGIWDRQSGPYSYSAPEAAAPAADGRCSFRPTATSRPRKGIVTVDDGDATSAEVTVSASETRRRRLGTLPA